MIISSKYHKIIKSLGEDGLLIKKYINKTIKNESKEQKVGFLRMLLGTLGASLLGNTLKELKRKYLDSKLTYLDEE